ncbi:MAG: hypothetical protein KDJ16_10435 [Hyphomicrobiales bacterium]|nr:hypothetical protein [Hyphomicrobiales bacterium]
MLNQTVVALTAAAIFAGAAGATAAGAAGFRVPGHRAAAENGWIGNPANIARMPASQIECMWQRVEVNRNDAPKWVRVKRCNAIRSS